MSCSFCTYLKYSLSEGIFIQVGVILGMYRDVNSIRRVSLSPNITLKDSAGHHPLTVLSWPTLDSPDEMRGSVTSSRNVCNFFAYKKFEIQPPSFLCQFYNNSI